MFIWNGLSVKVQEDIKKAVASARQKKTMIYVVAGIIALGIILFIRKK